MVNFKTPGTKEFKKIKYLKEVMSEEDPVIRKKAVLLYSSLMKTDYDSLIQSLEKELEQSEKALKPKRDMEEITKENMKPGDQLIINEINRIKFKLKYYTELQEMQIDSNLKKAKIKF